jgi:hypothetical protein
VIPSATISFRRVRERGVILWTVIRLPPQAGEGWGGVAGFLRPQRASFTERILARRPLFGEPQRLRKVVLTLVSSPCLCVSGRVIFWLRAPYLKCTPGYRALSSWLLLIHYSLFSSDTHMRLPIFANSMGTMVTFCDGVPARVSATRINTACTRW